MAPRQLKSIVGGPVRGHLHEDGCHRVETGRGRFPPDSMPWRLFAGMLSVTHCKRPFWLCRRVETEDSIGPQPSTPKPDILVSMSAGTPHHAAKMPEEATWACPGPDAHCTRWTVQLSPNLLGSGVVTIVTPLGSWISHGQLASSFFPAIACLLHGHSWPSHMFCP